MADWLESLERLGSGIVDAASEGLATRIKRELNPDAPYNPSDRPETQYDTRIEQPLDGEVSARDQGAEATAREIWNQYKWWIVGGMGVAAYLAWRR